LLKCFPWKEPEEAKPEKIRVELADAIAYDFFLAHERNLDVTEIIEEKIRPNTEKYPVDKARGHARSYVAHNCLSGDKGAVLGAYSVGREIADHSAELSGQTPALHTA
jgi:hypothetical protein